MYNILSNKYFVHIGMGVGSQVHISSYNEVSLNLTKCWNKLTRDTIRVAFPPTYEKPLFEKGNI
jgi:hypothetical protein